MFRLEDNENFLILRSFAASIAALLCGGDGSLLTHERVSKLTLLQHRPLSCKAGQRTVHTVQAAGAHTYAARELCTVLALTASATCAAARQTLLCIPLKWHCLE